MTNENNNFYLMKTLITKLYIKNVNVFNKYFNFAIILLFNFAIKLLKYINFDNSHINLVDNELLPYDLIYKLKLVKLEIPKTYVKINLV